MTKPKTGLAIHCHHDKLVEYCYDYNERRAYIKSFKPKNEQPLRLRLFKLLPPEAVAEIPLRYAKRVKADAKRVKADTRWFNAGAEWVKARAEWPQKSKDAFHKKWCGCKQWDGKVMVFPSKQKK